ncbi:LamG domain-containing protein [Mesorhizobium sp. M1A.F.Ca.IN.022.07.1.1]|uniref:LamG domain-containing protein n=1 Tax=unclassified Mesorhizobium TaxID=325217 RepID=UPI000FCC6568|nr:MULTISPECIES: LamG domain-containing protein [unclassified Mesorhizobium]MDG4889287.1 LamG domain-containing protein [Mesorhizobium sp. WSM4887]RUV91931.1 LamG domain-containing protein [Mesorhizobium sp. M1A.F.Ca.IN.022.07.1.1]RWG07349.1 MAG: LamG domain-containing protein [Mesorhizobium sp.]RWH03734.1 MAG: LamG domain-containing protein [Mesorhizobium sp.]TIN43842.1 MAG: LamG domain-containing protein [Mesorhizobium sp.]
MAINFAGGTNQLLWSPPTSQPVNGCVAFLMKTTQTTVNACPIACWNSSSRNGWGFVINNTLNKILAQGTNTTSTASIQLTSTTSINDGNWHHVAFNYRRNSGTNELFVNGVSEATGATSPSWNPTGSPALALGDNNDTFWPSYVGELAQIGHWSANLDAAEIAGLAKGFTPPKIRPASLISNIPLIREVNDFKAGLVPTVTGTSVSVHPRVVGPWF